MQIFFLQVALLILDVFFLNSKELQLPLQSLLTHTDCFKNLQTLSMCILLSMQKIEFSSRNQKRLKHFTNDLMPYI